MGPSTGGVRGFTVLVGHIRKRLVQRETPQVIAPAPFRISSHPIAAAVLLGCQISYLAIGLDVSAPPYRDERLPELPSGQDSTLASVSAPPITPVAQASPLPDFVPHTRAQMSVHLPSVTRVRWLESVSRPSRPPDFCRKFRRTYSPPPNFSIRDLRKPHLSTVLFCTAVDFCMPSMELVSVANSLRRQCQAVRRA